MTDIIEDVKNEICDDYCKWAAQMANESDEDYQKLLDEHRLYCMYRAERGGDVDLVLDQVSEDDYCSKGRM